MLGLRTGSRAMLRGVGSCPQLPGAAAAAVSPAQQSRRAYHWDNTRSGRHFRRNADIVPPQWRVPRKHKHTPEEQAFAEVPFGKREETMIDRLTSFAEADEIGEEYSLEELQKHEHLVLKDVNWSRYQRAMQVADADLFANQYTFEENFLQPREWEQGITEGPRSDRLNRETQLEQLKFFANLRYFLVIDQRMHTTITPAGRRNSWSAMIVAGNGRGVFCMAHCRGLDRDEAQTKAILSLHKNVIYVPMLENRTPFYNVVGKHRRTWVKLKVARREHAYHACPMIYYMARCVGYKDITTKVVGNRNKYQVVKAFMNALRTHTSDRDMAMRLGKNFYTMFDPITYRPQRPSESEMREQQLRSLQHMREARRQWRAKMGRRRLAGLAADHYEMVVDGNPDEKYRTLRPSDWILPRAPFFVPVPEDEAQVHINGAHFRKPKIADAVPTHV